MKLSELMSKRVITVTDGKEIGYVSDAELTKDLKYLQRSARSTSLLLIL